MIIAIHAGAGSFKCAADKLCLNALKANVSDGSGKSSSTLVDAVMALERCGALNCGFGSNLTSAGTVECEAAYMASEQMSFGAVAVVTNCVHPVNAAKVLSEQYQQSECTSPSGLVHPMVLAGPGADKFCASLGVGMIADNDALKSRSAVRSYVNAREYVARSSKVSNCSVEESLMHRLDTVGGVALDHDGNCEACVSSGGILLKKEGRLGHSAQFGAAIWAERQTNTNISVAVSLSGCGEALVRTHMAKALAHQILTLDLDDLALMPQIKQYLESHFLNSPLISMFPRDKRLLGGLVVVRRPTDAHSVPLSFSQRSLTDTEHPLTTILIAFNNSAQFPVAYVGADQKIRRFISSKTSTNDEFTCNLINL